MKKALFVVTLAALAGITVLALASLLPLEGVAVPTIEAQVADLGATAGEPLEIFPSVSSIGGTCTVHGFPLCDLCRPCPENCHQLCGDVCQCACVGCAAE